MFNQRKFDKVINQSRKIFNQYFYRTNDTYAEVMADGYFEDCRFFNEEGWSDGVLYVSCADGNFAVTIGDNTIQSPRSYINEIPVQSPYDLQNIDPTKMYVIDGIIDMTGSGVNMVIPSGGFNYRGLGIGVSGIICSDDNYTMFESAAGGSGTIFGSECFITVSGVNSKVHDLTDATGFNAFEFERVNWIDCTSLGEINNYRQGLEVGTGRLGGTPELTLSGVWGGYRVSTSIAFNMDPMSNGLFIAGTGLTMSGRFITDINCDMPSTGALFDFSDANIINDESLIVNSAYVQREGVLDASDSTLYPNIDHTSIKSNWGDNTGLPNTQKYIKLVCTAEVQTNIPSSSTYYPLLGTMTDQDSVQFDSPVNGQVRLLTGNGLYNIDGTIQIKGTQGDTVDLLITKSTDDGLTFPSAINHISLEIANLSGPDDFATYSINFSSSLKKNDRIRIEVKNNTAPRNVTMGSESYLILSEI